MAVQSAIVGQTDPLRVPTSGLEEDARVLSTVPEYLNRGQALLDWWREVERNGGPAEKFRLERSFNQPTRSFGFYGTAPAGGTMIPVMLSG